MPEARTLSSPSSIPLERPSCSLLIWAETEETLRPELRLIPHPTPQSRVQPPQPTFRPHLLQFRAHNPVHIRSSVRTIPPVKHFSIRLTLLATASTPLPARPKLSETSCTSPA